MRDSAPNLHTAKDVLLSPVGVLLIALLLFLCGAAARNAGVLPEKTDEARGPAFWRGPVRERPEPAVSHQGNTEPASFSPQPHTSEVTGAEPPRSGITAAENTKLQNAKSGLRVQPDKAAPANPKPATTARNGKARPGVQNNRPRAEASRPKDRPRKVTARSVQEKRGPDPRKKTVAISELAARLQAAIARGDEAKVTELVSRLEKLKGKRDPFLLKIRAYWRMERGDYENAAGLLEAVLSQRPDDFEAGFNMAVIEINTGRIDKARERLRALQELYPANEAISDLLGKLGD